MKKILAFAGNDNFNVLLIFLVSEINNFDMIFQIHEEFYI